MGNNFAKKKISVIRKPNFQLTEEEQKKYGKLLNSGYLPSKDCSEPKTAVEEYFRWLGIDLHMCLAYDAKIKKCKWIIEIDGTKGSIDDSPFFSTETALSRKLLQCLNEDKKFLFQLFDIAIKK